jgi:hypothetical protein
VRRVPAPLVRLLALAAALLLGPLPAPAHAANSPSVAAASRAATGYLTERLDDLATRSGPGDRLWFSSGRWHVGDSSCSRCLLGPTVVAAALVHRDPAAHRQERAEASAAMDRFLATGQRADGSFPAKEAPGSSVGVNTMFVGEQIATIDFLLGPHVDRARRARWTAAVAAAAGYLLRAGHPDWYANGNINLGYTLIFGLAARLTGRADLRRAYEASWDFVLDPPAPRWRRYGLRYRTVPRRSDGADGAGYLTEEGGGGIGFDAHYAQLQADVATRMWLTLGDRRALRLVNLLNGMLLPRVNESSWMLNTSSGTRNTRKGLSYPFLTASLAAGATGCRAAEAGRIPGQVLSMARWFDRNLDPHSLYDNGSWAFYLGESAANFVLLDERSACG